MLQCHKRGKGQLAFPTTVDHPVLKGSGKRSDQQKEGSAYGKRGTAAQGLRIKHRGSCPAAFAGAGQELGHVTVVPGRVSSTRTQTSRLVLPLPQRVKGQFAKDGNTARGYSATAARFVLPKDDVEYPVQAVFNRPVASHGLHQHRKKAEKTPLFASICRYPRKNSAVNKGESTHL